MTFLELAEIILKEEAKPLTANEIWSIAVKKGYEKQLNSQGKTPWATLGALIYVSCVNSVHVDPSFWDVDPPAKQAIRVRA